jgi:toxin YoeB
MREIPFAKLVEDLAGAYSRRINIHRRLVYQVMADIRTVKVIRMWPHDE